MNAGGGRIIGGQARRIHIAAVIVEDRDHLDPVFIRSLQEIFKVVRKV